MGLAARLVITSRAGFLNRLVFASQFSILNWIALILFGLALLYSLWRSFSKFDGCPKCKAKNMIPADSPVAKKFLRDLV